MTRDLLNHMTAPKTVLADGESESVREGHATHAQFDLALLDELARCFVLAAVDRLFSERPLNED